MIDDVMNFDGAGEAPSRLGNNLSDLPRPGTPEFDARNAAEVAARDIAGSGINPTRLQVLAAEKAAGDRARAELAATERRTPDKERAPARLA